MATQRLAPRSRRRLSTNPAAVAARARRHAAAQKAAAPPAYVDRAAVLGDGMPAPPAAAPVPCAPTALAPPAKSAHEIAVAAAQDAIDRRQATLLGLEDRMDVVNSERARLDTELEELKKLHAELRAGRS